VISFFIRQRQGRKCRPLVIREVHGMSVQKRFAGSAQRHESTIIGWRANSAEVMFAAKRRGMRLVDEPAEDASLRARRILAIKVDE
jgi:hypothetical protein